MVYLAPVMTALFAWGISQLAGWLAWIIMAVMFQPMLRFYRLSPLWGLALPLIGVFYAAFTLEFGVPALGGQGRHVEGPGPGRCEKAGGTGMSSVAGLQSGKGHGDENFPVASFLIAPRNRAPVMAFYNFVRAADDVADSATAAAGGKAAAAGTDAPEPGSAKATACPKAWPCEPYWRSAVFSRAMPWTCWKPSAATAPSCAIATGTT